MLGDLGGQKLKQVKSLQGYWSFSVGDDLAWRLPGHDFSKWDKIYTGSNWESQGYEGYNGYAWYKRNIDITGVTPKSKLILRVDNIDDADEVYFNGVLIGSTGGFPPKVETAYDKGRTYVIDSKIINYKGNNTIAIRVYDFYLNGGILGQIGLFEDITSSYLIKDLSGKWKFKPGSNLDWKNVDFNDTEWDEINVPQKWESQGFENVDGLAWYRKSFYWSDLKDDGNLIVTLGRIDDQDITYLNGQKIGSVVEMKRNNMYYAGKEDYKTLRAYKITRAQLRKGKNIIAVKVIDHQYDGGIYEGPVGIMTESAFIHYYNKYEKKKGFFDYLMESFWD